MTCEPSTNIQSTLGNVILPDVAGNETVVPGVWTWNMLDTVLSADDAQHAQNFMATFTPKDADNYLTLTAVSVPVKVSEVIAVFQGLGAKEITTADGTVDVKADVSVKGAALPTTGDLQLGKIVSWSNSCPSIVSFEEKNIGATYAATVTGLKKGISMMSIAVSGTPISSVVVKYTPPAVTDSTNAAGEIDSVTDTISEILKTPTT